MDNPQVLPDVRADRIEFGWEATLERGGELTSKELRARLKRCGEITTPASKRHDGYTQLTLELQTDRSAPAGRMLVELHFRRHGNDLQFGNRCAIRMNGLDMLRGELGPATCGALSFDQKTNVLGGQHSGRELTVLQLDLIEEAVEHVLEALAAAFGNGWAPLKLWIRSGEVCRDTVTTDAVADLRILSHGVVEGTTSRRLDQYRRTSCSEAAGIPVLRFVNRAYDPEDKIYPKREDIRRSELTFKNRRCITEMTGNRSSAFEAKEGRALVLHLLTLAEPRLDRLDRWAIDALRGRMNFSIVLIRLKPLIDRAAGVGKGKGPASPQASRLACRALQALLSVGFFDAVGHHANHAFRRDLDALCGSDGPLRRGPVRSIYYLAPDLVRSCSIMPSG